MLQELIKFDPFDVGGRLSYFVLESTGITFNFDPFDQEVGSPISVRKGA